MLREEMEWVKAEIKKAITEIKFPETPKPVDLDEVANYVIAKIQEKSAETSPKKGKEK